MNFCNSTNKIIIYIGVYIQRIPPRFGIRDLQIAYWKRKFPLQISYPSWMSATTNKLMQQDL
jgi:hypothetical protein